MIAPTRLGPPDDLGTVEQRIPSAVLAALARDDPSGVAAALDGQVHVRQALVQVLGATGAEQLPEVVRRCAQTEEFAGRDPEDLREVLDQLVPLAPNAARQGKGLYCWMSV